VEKTLEQVLAAWRSEAAVLRRHGHKNDAERIEKLCSEVENAATDYLRFLGETDAALRTGRSVKWLRSNFPKWERQGHARKHAGRRFYRAVVLPTRDDLGAAREAGRAAARE